MLTNHPDLFPGSTNRSNPASSLQIIQICSLVRQIGQIQLHVCKFNDSIVVQYVYVVQVRNVIKSLTDSSPGWDHLSPFVMKQCVDTYVEPITILINNSFYHGIFPDEFKASKGSTNIQIW